jgi:hypothetical protein
MLRVTGRVLSNTNESLSCKSCYGNKYRTLIKGNSKNVFQPFVNNVSVVREYNRQSCLTSSDYLTNKANYFRFKSLMDQIIYAQEVGKRNSSLISESIVSRNSPFQSKESEQLQKESMIRFEATEELRQRVLKLKYLGKGSTITTVQKYSLGWYNSLHDALLTEALECQKGVPGMDRVVWLNV